MPWAIARRFAHKTTSYGYLKTYWPAHALRFARGGRVDWAKGEGKAGRRERSEWPSPQINQRILRPFVFPSPSRSRQFCLGSLLLLLLFFVSPLAREFWAKRITGVAEGRHKTIRVHGHGLRVAASRGLLYASRSATRNREQFNRACSTRQSGSSINGYRVSRPFPLPEIRAKNPPIV